MSGWSRVVSCLLVVSILVAGGSTPVSGDDCVPPPEGESYLGIQGRNGTGSVLTVVILDECLRTDGRVEATVSIKMSRQMRIPYHVTFRAVGGEITSLSGLTIRLYPGANWFEAERMVFPPGSALTIIQDKFGADAVGTTQMLLLDLTTIFLILERGEGLPTGNQSLLEEAITAATGVLPLPLILEIALIAHEVEQGNLREAASSLTSLANDVPEIVQWVVGFLAVVGPEVTEETVENVLGSLPKILFRVPAALAALRQIVTSPAHVETTVKSLVRHGSFEFTTLWLTGVFQPGVGAGCPYSTPILLMGNRRTSGEWGYVGNDLRERATISGTVDVYEAVSTPDGSGWPQFGGLWKPGEKADTKLWTEEWHLIDWAADEGILQPVPGDGEGHWYHVLASDHWDWIRWDLQFTEGNTLLDFHRISYQKDIGGSFQTSTGYTTAVDCSENWPPHPLSPRP